MRQILKAELSKNIHPSLIDELLKEYQDLSEGYNLNDNSKTLSAAGRFVEIVLATISYIYDKKLINLNKINFDKLYSKITNLPKKNGNEELLYLAIPRAARTIKTIRDKKRGSHRKDLDPFLEDRVLIKSSADWILASFIYLYSTEDEKVIKSIIENIIEKQLPLIEDFEDGGIMILKKISFAKKLLVILYVQKEMITKEKLKHLARPKYIQEFNTGLLTLEKKLLVYNNSNNLKITKNGKKEVEKLLLNT